MRLRPHLSAASGGANRCPFAAAGQAADERAERCAAARHHGCRLPLPFIVRLMADVSIFCSLPFTVIEVSLSSREAPPLNLPKGFASTTVPRAEAPAGITALPSTVTAEARVPLKESPGELIFDPTEFPSLTVRVVPSGMTTDCGSGALVCAAGDAEEPIALPPAALAGAAAFPPAAFEDPVAFWLAASEAVSAGFFEHAMSENNRKLDKHTARENA